MRYAHLTAPCLQIEGINEACLVKVSGNGALCARPAYPLLESTQCYVQVSADPVTYQAWTDELPHPVADAFMALLGAFLCGSIAVAIVLPGLISTLRHLAPAPLPNSVSGSIT